METESDSSIEAIHSSPGHSSPDRTNDRTAATELMNIEEDVDKLFPIHDCESSQQGEHSLQKDSGENVENQYMLVDDHGEVVQIGKFLTKKVFSNIKIANV